MAESGRDIATGDIAFEVELPDAYYPAVERVIEALHEEGFGVVTRMDLDKIFKDKLGIDYKRFVILGACNPRLALKAMSRNTAVGLLLPCNVTVEPMQGEGSRVRILDPLAMLGPLASDEDDAEIGEVAEEARERLQRVAEALAS